MLKTMKNKIKLNNKTHKLATFAMLRRGERFGEDIGNHAGGREEVDFDLASFDDFANPMPLYVDMFHAAMMLRIVEYPESGLVVNK